MAFPIKIEESMEKRKLNPIDDDFFICAYVVIYITYLYCLK